MRLTTAAILTFFVTTGLSSPSLPRAGSSPLAEPSCNEGRLYTIEPGEDCKYIAAANNAPSYQIICENDQINGQCTNPTPDEDICLGRQGEDCKEIYVFSRPDTPQSIAQKFNIPWKTFQENNYCYDTAFSMICPDFNDGTVLCIDRNPIGPLPKCQKIFS